MFSESYKLVSILFLLRWNLSFMKCMWISGNQTSSVLSITGILLVYCYVSIVIAMQFLVWSVAFWISNTLYTSKFFVLVVFCHIYLTLGSLCFSLYIGTAHYSILQFLVFVYPFVYMFCLHYVLQVVTLQALDGPSLAELSTWD